MLILQNCVTSSDSKRASRVTDGLWNKDLALKLRFLFNLTIDKK